MGNYYSQMPESIQKHLRAITVTSGLPESEDSYELMAEAWTAKKEAFEKEIQSRYMEETEFHSMDDVRGALVLTCSGSLINIGALRDDGRSAEYTSIGIRSDVPDSAEHSSSQLSNDVVIGSEVEFTEGPVSRSSAVYKIAVCSQDLDLDEQDEALSGATMVIAQEFADINKTVVIE